jgi:hypothetical protein
MHRPYAAMLVYSFLSQLICHTPTSAIISAERVAIGYEE